MASISSSDMVSRGRPMLEEGRFEEAIEIFETACADNPDAVEPKVELFNALRQSALTQYLAGFFVESMGWAKDRFQGLRNIGPIPGFDSVAPRLHQLGEQIGGMDENAKNLSLRAVVDRQVLGHSAAVDDFSRKEMDADLTGWDYLLMGEMELERGENEKAVLVLSAAMEEGFHGALVYRLLGKAFYRLKKCDEALSYFNLAQIYPDTHWFDELPLSEKRTLISFGNYKGLDLYCYEGQYFAAQDWEGGRVDYEDGKLVLYEHRFKRGLRSWIIRTLPEGAVNFLQLIVAWPPVRRWIVVKSDKTNSIIKAPNLVKVIAEIDILKEGADRLPSPEPGGEPGG